MNKLSTTQRVQILHLLCEGNSLRSTSRITGCSINTVTKLLVDAGTACQQYQDKHLRNLSCKRVQLDEIWSFVHSKQRNVPEEKRGQVGYGDVYTWTALCADSKLMISWLCGARDAGYAMAFVDDLAPRLKNRVQLTSDGFKSYLYAVDAAFGGNVDYSMLVKLYGPAPEGPRRYSPPQCLGAEKRPVIGKPDPKHISTSYVERSNLTIRMMNRRFTRLTNAFSKKLENHVHAFSMFAMHYNFCRIHKSLGVTPAMEAGVSGHVWTLENVVEMMDESMPKPGKRGPYKKANSN
ncbi:MAG: IS1 family transposase [Deltaproteobacteria bacterium]|nr:IS1 family transposase [Deltaproteobacteria bacterium]